MDDKQIVQPDTALRGMFSSQTESEFMQFSKNMNMKNILHVWHYSFRGGAREVEIMWKRVECDKYFSRKALSKNDERQLFRRSYFPLQFSGFWYIIKRNVYIHDSDAEAERKNG